MKRDAILRTVWAQDAADVALLEAARGKIVRHNADRIGELSVSERASGWTIDQRGLVAELLCAMQDEWRQRSFGYGDIRIGAFNNHCSLYRISGFCRIYRITA